jgi:hypothetical protein
MLRPVSPVSGSGLASLCHDREHGQPRFTSKSADGQGSHKNMQFWSHMFCIVLQSD